MTDVMTHLVPVYKARPSTPRGGGPLSPTTQQRYVQYRCTHLCERHNNSQVRVPLAVKARGNCIHVLDSLMGAG